MRRRQFAAVLLAACLGITLAAAPRPALAESEPTKLVKDSRHSLERILTDPSMPGFKDRLAQARAVLIIPELYKGGIIVGAEGGSGVLLVRGADGTWSAPAFYTLAAGSIGLQLGAQISEVVFTLMTDGAVESLLANEMKLGADASVAVGPLGIGLEASTTTNVGADIYAFSRAVGLFGGGSLEGAKLISRGEWNQEYYGAPASPRAVVIERRFFNPQADELRAVLARPPS